jgi:thioredoxin reductase (NADPH)
LIAVSNCKQTILNSGSTKRVGFAVGDGSLAVTCAHRLLSIAR